MTREWRGTIIMDTETIRRSAIAVAVVTVRIHRRCHRPTGPASIEADRSPMRSLGLPRSRPRWTFGFHRQSIIRDVSCVRAPAWNCDFADRIPKATPPAVREIDARPRLAGCC
jgi:hypothetical protein